MIQKAPQEATPRGLFLRPAKGEKMLKIILVILMLAVLVTDILMLSIAWTHRPFTLREIFDSLRDLLRSRKDR